jgi:ParB-like chromosome segregation protein Spo0J
MAQRKDITLIPVSQFTTDGLNKRIDQGDLAQLAATLKEAYATDPYSIPPVYGHRSKGQVVVTDGHRRLAAAQLAGLPSLPYLPFSSDLLDRLTAQATHNNGKPFTDVENAELCAALTAAYVVKNPGAKKAEVREFVMSKMNISQPTFYNYEKLQQALPEVQELVTQGKIAATRVREIMTNTKDQNEVLVQVQQDIADAESLAAEEGAQAPAKATRASAKKAKTEKTPFEDKTPQAKLNELVAELIDSPSEGAQFLIQLDAALKGNTPKEEILTLIDSFNTVNQ